MLNFFIKNQDRYACKKHLQSFLKANLSWSPTQAKFCQLITKLSIVLS